MNEWTSVTTDTALLREYCSGDAEDAFAELVRRRLPLVYSTILRQLGADPSAAEDIAQSVFIALARDARKLVNHPVLAGWLYLTATRMAKDHNRRQVRRHVREQTLMQPSAPSPAPEIAWEQLKPVLDEALLQLSEEDRHAVILRFIEQRDFNAIGSELGVRPDAARMRVARALDKLRSSLVARGLLSGGVLLETLLAQSAAVTVPNGLAATIGTTVRQLGFAPIPTPALAWTARKWVLAGVAGLIGGGSALIVGLPRLRNRIFRTPAAVLAAQEANARINEQFRPRWIPRAPNRSEAATAIDSLVSEALGYLRTALFDTSLDPKVRNGLLEQSAGMLVGHEEVAVTLFRDAFHAMDHRTVSMAIEGIARFGQSYPKEFKPELMGLLENPEYKKEASLIANRLLFAMKDGESPVPELLALLQRRPDLHEQIADILQSAIANRPNDLAECLDRLKTVARESSGDVQQAAREVFDRLPSVPTPASPELVQKLLTQLQSPEDAARTGALLGFYGLRGSTPEISEKLAELMVSDPLPANRLTARLALIRTAPDHPSLAGLRDSSLSASSADFQKRSSRGEVSVAELINTLADRPENSPGACRAITQIPASYWLEHLSEQIQVKTLLSSLHQFPDAQVWEAASDALGAFNHAPRQYYTVEELKPFFEVMEASLTPGEYAIAIRDNDFEGQWNSAGFKQPEPIHLRTGQVQTLLVGPFFQNPPAYDAMLKAMKAIDPKFEPPAR